MRFIGVLAFSAYAVFAAQMVSAATIMSGDFEGDNSVWSVVGATGSGPTCSSADVISGVCSGVLNSGGTPRGVGLEQSVSGFVIGESYSLDLAVSNFRVSFGNPGTDEFGIFAVQASGTTSAETSSNSLGLFNDEYAVGSFGLSFVATQDTIVLQFLSQLTTDRSFVIDDVTLSGTGTGVVPVPASLPLLAVGLGVLGFMARRKRKSA